MLGGTAGGPGGGGEGGGGQRSLGLAVSCRDVTGVPDELVALYCLENMKTRADILKELVGHKGEDQMTVFAAKVANATGCRHNGYQVVVAKRLLREGRELWEKVSRQQNRAVNETFQLPWAAVIKALEERFKAISGCKTRGFSAQDSSFLRAIAGCEESISKEQWERLWQWAFPVALSLSSPQFRQAWESQEPKWIEGMVTREEAEAMLRAPQGPSGSPSLPGSFLLRFASSRLWPHPDAGALVVTLVTDDVSNAHKDEQDDVTRTPLVRHKLLALEDGMGFCKEETSADRPPLSELLLSLPLLKTLCRTRFDSIQKYEG